jgi:hypothetical protein
MVDETDLEAALASQREQRGNVDQMRADYNSRILHLGTVRIAGAEARLTQGRAAVPGRFPGSFTASLSQIGRGRCLHVVGPRTDPQEES